MSGPAPETAGKVYRTRYWWWPFWRYVYFNQDGSYWYAMTLRSAIRHITPKGDDSTGRIGAAVADRLAGQEPT